MVYQQIELEIIKQMKFEGQMKQIDIVKKYNKYPEFKKQLDEIQAAYQNSLNMSLYSTLTKVQQLQIFSIIPQQPNHSFLYVNFYGFRMPNSQQDSNKVYLLWIRLMDQLLRNNPKKKYIITYFHNLTDSSYPYSFLKNIFKKLPIQYYAQLQNLYIIEPNIMLKSVGLLDFGRLHKLYSRRLIFINTILQLTHTNPFKKDNIEKYIPQILNKSESTDQKKEIQQIQKPKQLKKDFLTIQFNQHKFTPDGMPICLESLFQTMKANPNMLKLQGIFRKSGSIQQQEEIITYIQKLDKIQILKITQFSGYSIAGVIKKFFTKLLTPIISYQIYNKILNTTSIRPQQQIPFAKDFINELPKPQKKVFLMTIIFLRQNVIPFQQQNKMNNYNMSVVFCPCFFRAQNPSLNDLMNSGRFAAILNIIFHKFDEIIASEEKMNLSKRQSRGRKSRGSRGQA